MSQTRRCLTPLGHQKRSGEEHQTDRRQQDQLGQNQIHGTIQMQHGFVHGRPSPGTTGWLASAAAGSFALMLN